MVTITRWSPFSEFSGLPEAKAMFINGALLRPARFIAGHFDEAGECGMPVDLSETDDSFTVCAVLPGVRADDLDVNMVGDVLTIKGETKMESEAAVGTVHSKEIRYGRYARSFTLPMPVQSDKAEASFEDGVLRLKLPKVEAAKPRQIMIQPRVVIDANTQN